MEKNTDNTYFQLNPEVINRIASKRIYFGHMSVGRNILSGTSRYISNNSLDIKIVDNIPMTDLNIENGFIYHTQIGKNGNPYSKIKDFEFKINSELSTNIDVAFFKFCYVDFIEGTDVESVFKIYTETMDSLSSKYPDIIFTHSTVPLRKLQSGFKAFVKKMIGRSIGLEDNIARNKFNKLLKKRYQNDAAIFDIALYESTKPNNQRAFIKVGNDTCYTLVPDYTYDGGHLNTIGEDYLGEQLLVFLSQISK
ncbi:hypothetical protein [Plebeiibacterium sediminum]|uniref:Uncharacterized protein n=1 Tax=Plebeiibacterium sediminum TaxID=2992112 RepID=A0AAE3M2V5_9BACT|nr:hypothetical protein [Plebeiobacterium sediminum]MCW3786236.1 hypothetical protein [Plebeiobacterium sediminum]